MTFHDAVSEVNKSVKFNTKNDKQRVPYRSRGYVVFMYCLFQGWQIYIETPLVACTE
jgi:hypothetical protein